MARKRHLNNAPITEALIDFRVVTPTSFSAEAFLSLKPILAERYPIVEERRGFETQFALGKGSPPKSQFKDLGIHGYFFKTSDGLHIAQFRSDGFTFNRLKPYTAWENILPEALRIWKLYIDVVSPESVSRLAVRYINHIAIPSPVGDFSNYLTTPPMVPSELPQNVSSFLVRLVIHDSNLELAANITQALEKGIDPSSVTIIFDIDAYKAGEFDPNGEEIVNLLNMLRNFKNDIFFNSLTEKTVEAYE
jgi:uncharacterized protein (TIGR04255 family)